MTRRGIIPPYWTRTQYNTIVLVVCGLNVMFIPTVPSRGKMFLHDTCCSFKTGRYILSTFKPIKAIHLDTMLRDKKKNQHRLHL